MKYVQPYGITDPDASYINGDPSVGRMGSIPPAAAFENPMREIVAVIEKSKITPSDADLTQMVKGIRSQRMNYAEDTGSANALSVAFDPAITTYTIGLPIRVKVANNNTGASTINAGGGTVQIKKPNGAQVAAGDLISGGLIDLVYDGTAFQMINFGGAGGTTGDVFMVNVPYCVDTSPTPNTIVANFSPAITSIVAGTMVMVKVANTNTGPTSIVINGLPSKLVYAQGGAPNWPLLPSDMIAGDVLIFTYDGTRFWIYANTILNQSISVTVSNNTQYNDFMYALGRKRILTGNTVTVQLAQGTFGPIAVNHPSADHIIVTGTMKAGGGGVPSFGNFFKSGNSPTARSIDSSNNYYMLDARYGTKIQFDNTPTYYGNMLTNTGPGRPKFSNIWLVGPNVAAVPIYIPNAAAAPAPGCSMSMDGVTLWGGGASGFGVAQAVMDCNKCYICSSQLGWGAVMGGQLALSECGSFGNAYEGIQTNRRGSVSTHARTGIPGLPDVPGCQIMMNARHGVVATTMGQVELDRCTVTGNGYQYDHPGTVDIAATNASNISLGGGGTTYNTTSPALNTVGNNNSIITS